MRQRDEDLLCLPKLLFNWSSRVIGWLTTISVAPLVKDSRRTDLSSATSNCGIDPAIVPLGLISVDWKKSEGF